MSCPCYTLELTRLTYSFEWVMERTCEEVVDLVPFNAADGRFLTAEGYTILVKL